MLCRCIISSIPPFWLKVPSLSFGTQWRFPARPPRVAWGRHFLWPRTRQGYCRVVGQGRPRGGSSLGMVLAAVGGSGARAPSSSLVAIGRWGAGVGLVCVVILRVSACCQGWGGLGRTLCVLGSAGSGCQRPVSHWSTLWDCVVLVPSHNHRILYPGWFYYTNSPILTLHCIALMIDSMWQVMVLVVAWS